MFEIFSRYKKNPIFTRDDWPYPVNSVFNAGATRVGEEVVLLVRCEDRRGISHLNVARSRDGKTNWQIDDKPTFPPEPDKFPEEVWGVEDPRITYLVDDNIYAITYTAFSKNGPLVSLALTEDFKTFKKYGAITLPENKDAALFPVKFGGRYAMIHRPSLSGPDAHIWIGFSPDLKHWGDHRLLVRARGGPWWDAHHIGLSTPPILTSEGWVFLYHGAHMTVRGPIYRLGFVLLDAEKPWVVLRRSDEWVFSPEKEFERVGDVENVVFPCGWVVKEGVVFLYYGAADFSMALATARVSDIVEYLKTCPEYSEEHCV